MKDHKISKIIYFLRHEYKIGPYVIISIEIMDLK